MNMFEPPNFQDVVFRAKKNGSASRGEEISFPSNSSLELLFNYARKILLIEEPVVKAFFSNGTTVDEVEEILPGDVIHFCISFEEPFQLSAVKAVNTGGGKKVVHHRKVSVDVIEEEEEEISGSDDEKKVIVGKCWELLEELGRGGFGRVHRARNAETEEECAIKFMSKSSFGNLNALERAFSEINVLRDLNHPNITRIIDVIDDPENICFCMEFCGGGDLCEYVENNGNPGLKPPEVLFYYEQVVKGLAFSHSKGIAHRDLKPENVLLSADLKQAKVADFGLAGVVEKGAVTDAGTAAYLAPEVWKGESSKSDPLKIDIWALGVMFLVMYKGKLLWKAPTPEVCNKIDSYSAKIPQDMKEYARILLVVDPDQRASIQQARTHPYMTKDRFVQL